MALLVEKREAMKKGLDLRDHSEPTGWWHTEVLNWTRTRVAVVGAASSQLFAAVAPVRPGERVPVVAFRAGEPELPACEADRKLRFSR